MTDDEKSFSRPWQIIQNKFTQLCQILADVPTENTNNMFSQKI